MKYVLLSVLVLLMGMTTVVIGADETVAGKCMTCHKEESPGLYNQWYASEHAAHNVTCLECHAADRNESDAFEHEGAFIATLVTPKDCSSCHEKQATEVQASHHATAGEILESNDAYLAHAAGGDPAALAGCESCHGTKVLIDEASPNKLARNSWPNGGIGRLNPDGSKGSCTACHPRHTMATSQARRPEACAKCHLGPDHPQKEIYEESKHGNAFFSSVDEMNLKADRWIVGIDYFHAPTCATCHMSATTKTPLTHDVGKRLSWNLRAPISKMMENWEVKREAMQSVCINCHGKHFVEGHYTQLDGLTNLYNDKFAKPARELHTMAKDKKLGDGVAGFSNKYEWIYWEIWHHEGRRARHGVAMMGPDYTWWHGIYEVAQHFYFKYLPELRKFHDPEIDAYIDNMLANDPMHQWLQRPTGDIKADIESGKLKEIYADMYGIK